MTPRAPMDAPSDPRGELGDAALAEAQTNRYPVVASQFARRDRAGLMLGASLALLLGSATLFAMAGNRHAAQPEAPAQPVQSPAPYAMAPALMPVPAAAPTLGPAPLAAPMTMPAPALMAQPGRGPDRLQAPAVVFDNGAAAGGPATAPTGPVGAAAPGTDKVLHDDLSAEELFARRVAGKAETVTADRMVNPASTVAQGTLMSAVLETAINSDLPGFVRAVISQDVRSYDGRHVLIPRGSHLIGEYKSNLAVGQSRAYILWTRLLRPDGVSIALASPATDYAGQNGLGGKVDSHFLKRFGAAILLSVIGAAGQAIGGGNGTVVLAGPQAAVTAGAQRDIGIPPTVKIGLGQPIRVFTAKDLDFSSVSSGL